MHLCSPNFYAETTYTNLCYYFYSIYAQNEVLHRVIFHVLNLFNGKPILHLDPDDKVCNASIFQRKPYYYNGDCYTLSIPKCIAEKNVQAIVIETYIDVDIFISHRGHFLHPNSRNRVDVDKSFYSPDHCSHLALMKWPQLCHHDHGCSFAQTHDSEAQFKDDNNTNHGLIGLTDSHSIGLI